MPKLEPFLSLDENLGEFDLGSSIKEFFKLLKEEHLKDENNECTILKCPDCEGLLVQIPEKLPLEVKCMNCKVQFRLRDILSS
jgi:hypothetical protein